MKPALAFSVGFAAAVATVAARGDLVYTSGHADLGFALSGSIWSAAVHHEDESDPVVPSEAIFYGRDGVAGGSAGWIVRPVGSEYDFLGVAAGASVFLLPQAGTHQGVLPWLGLSSEDVAPALIAMHQPADARVATAARWIRLGLVSVQHLRPDGSPGNGDLALWSSGAFGAPLVWWSTAAPPADGQHQYLLAGSHQHFNWGFTEAGDYTLSLLPSAPLASSGGVATGPAIPLRIRIEPMAVPEPAVAGLLLIGLACLRHTLCVRTSQAC